MKTMNRITQEKISIAVINAIDDEDLYFKEVANILHVPRYCFTLLKNDKYWDKISKEAWKVFQEWMYSGKKLKGYKPSADLLKEEPEQTDPEPEKKDIYSDLRKAKPGVIKAGKEEIEKKKQEEEENPTFIGPYDPEYLSHLAKAAEESVPDKVLTPDLVQKIILEVEVRLSIKQ
jgi:hypothetical protein